MVWVETLMEGRIDILLAAWRDMWPWATAFLILIVACIVAIMVLTK